MLASGLGRMIGLAHSTCNGELLTDRDMKVAFIVEVDETETTYSKQELLDMGLYALTDAYEKTGAYFDIGYNPQLVTSGRDS